MKFGLVSSCLTPVFPLRVYLASMCDSSSDSNPLKTAVAGGSQTNDKMRMKRDGKTYIGVS